MPGLALLQLGAELSVQFEDAFAGKPAPTGSVSFFRPMQYLWERGLPAKNGYAVHQVVAGYYPTRRIRTTLNTPACLRFPEESSPWPLKKF
jgi:hypothetical protein